MPKWHPDSNLSYEVRQYEQNLSFYCGFIDNETEIVTACLNITSEVSRATHVNKGEKLGTNAKKSTRVTLGACAEPEGLLLLAILSSALGISIIRTDFVTGYSLSL